MSFFSETDLVSPLHVFQDGNAWSARFKRLLNSNALVLKSTIYPEWWNDRIQPWVHYVPVKVDYDDIYDIMIFVRRSLLSFRLPRERERRATPNQI